MDVTMSNSNRLTKHALQRVLKGKDLRVARVRVVLEAFRPPATFGGKPSADVIFQTVDAQGRVLSEMGRATVVEGNDVTIAEIDRAFTFTLA